jgi:hypothetical protein
LAFLPPAVLDGREEERRAGVAEGVQCDPRDAGAAGGGSEHLGLQVVAVEARPARRGEDELAVGVGRLHVGQLADEAGRERDVALAVARLGLADAVVGELPAQLEVGAAGQDDVAAPAQLAGLADAHAGVGHELEEQLSARWDLGHDLAQLGDRHRALLG